MEKIVAQICERIGHMQDKSQIIIAIDGSCTSGKSTLAQMLGEKLDCNLFRMDDFFLRPEQRSPERLAKTGGNVDYERFQEEVLLPMKAGEPFSFRPFDCRSGTLAASVAVIPRRINVIEGSYSHHPYFGDPYDLKVFLKVSPRVRLERIRKRPSFLQKRFLEEWIPMEQRYFTEFAIEEKADLAGMPEDNQ